MTMPDKIFVWVMPGQIELTVISYFANSCAAVFVKLITAPLLAAYIALDTSTKPLPPTEAISVSYTHLTLPTSDLV